MKTQHSKLRLMMMGTLITVAVLIAITGNSPQPTLNAGASPQGGGRPTATPTPKPRATPSSSPVRPTPRQSLCTAQSPTRGTGREFSESLSGGVKLEMVEMPAGSFCMGSPSSGKDSLADERPQHRVNVPQFDMGKYEVTQAQWQAVMGANPSRSKGDDLPVERVKWDDAVEFCRKLSQMTGKKYRLPTEAEWEYAGRAGTKGNYAGSLDALGWYANNSGRTYLDFDPKVPLADFSKRIKDNGNQTHPVGTKQPNAFGLYDMHGNVW